MKGDFSRFGFDLTKHFSRVLHQQGRVALDADANEASEILLHHLRTLTRDLFGAFGGPADGNGFLLAFAERDNRTVLTVSAGHYYVDGILVENETACEYTTQPDWTPAPPDANGNGGDPLLAWLRSRDPDARFWVYLDVWERHVTWIEDDSIREVALNGPDTCTRARVVWQIKALPWDPAWSDEATRDLCARPLDSLPQSTARLAARLDPGPAFTDPCIVAPDARYRGAENHLYRVEIHRGGEAGIATFKWSRDNASVATPWLGSEGGVLLVRSGRGFAAGDWVELSHDALELNGVPGQLLRLSAVEGDRLTVDAASVPPAGQMAWSDQLSNPKLRRWDQRGHEDVVLVEGAVPVEESTGADPQWLDLEAGVQIAFAADGEYRSGDYWLIPARVATGAIVWPVEADGDPIMREPDGIVHHYAPLAIVSWNDGPQLQPCRRCVEIPAVACRSAAITPAPPRRDERRPPGKRPGAKQPGGRRTRPNP